MASLNKILVPTDFSEDSTNALQYAQELARKFGSEIILLHVVQVITPIAIGPTPGGGYDPVAMETMGKIADEQRQLSEQELKRQVEQLTGAGLRARAVLRTGSPFVEIISAASTEKADLITMGTHGRTGLAHILMGSTAERVVRKAPCPVLTVRHPDRKFKHPLDA
jgi:universal stress protein A